jgi:hypothetical protein
MTKRTNRRRRNSGGLKALLLSASVIATIGGARLLDLQEPAQASASTQAVSIVEPETSAPPAALPRAGRTATLDLKPIPQAAIPRFNPVARSHSSM